MHDLLRPQAFSLFGIQGGWNAQLRQNDPSRLDIAQRADMTRLQEAHFDKGNDLDRNGGQGGIRTHGTLSRTHAFQACALNHSATCPSGNLHVWVNANHWNGAIYIDEFVRINPNLTVF